MTIDTTDLIKALEERKRQLSKWTDKDRAKERIDEIDCIIGTDIPYLVKEESEKPMQEGLEEEIDRFEDWMETYNQADYPTSYTTRDIARHFYDLGCHRTAEKYDEIEYNRQRAEESVPNDLEEAAEISFDEAYALTEDYRDFLAKGLTEKRPRPIGPHWFCEYAKNRFIAGAKWQAEQDQETIELAEDHAYLAGSVNEREKMMSEAVEGVVEDVGVNYIDLIDFDTEKLGLIEGDKVRVIVCKKED